MHNMSLTFISEYNQTYQTHTSCYYCLELTLCYTKYVEGTNLSNLQPITKQTMVSPYFNHCREGGRGEIVECKLKMSQKERPRLLQRFFASPCHAQNIHRVSD